MRNSTKPLIAGVIAVVLCSVLIVAIVFALYSERPSSVSETAASGPSSPLPTLPEVAPTNTAQPTEEEPIKYYPPVSDRPDATPVPLTPEPYVPPTPFPEAATFSDPSGIITLTVPKGWYSSPPPMGILQSEAVIANFDLESMEGPPAGAIVVHIVIGEMEAGQTIEEWLAQRI
jgi:hypothetical protein